MRKTQVGVNPTIVRRAEQAVLKSWSVSPTCYLGTVVLD